MFQLMAQKKVYLLPVAVISVALALWMALSSLGVFPPSAFPSPVDVAQGFGEDLATGQLMNDLIASMFRVAVGFSLAVALSIPLGLLLGYSNTTRVASLPIINFFRNLSPLAWIPFAILWFGIGDTPAIFLIFISTFFPLVLATVGAYANIPTVYFRVAQEYGFRGSELLTSVMLPAILPQIITALRVACGVAWLVVVAAEMIAGRDGLGFSIWDARNGLRSDLLVCRMIVIGVIGIALDMALVQLTKMRRVRWGYER
jgi:NitT/TauT family transport system permease protein